MKDSRTVNSSRNIVFGFINRIINMGFPFIIRSAIIHELGIQYLGLNSLFTSILGVLNLAELGIGSALTFSMYEPAEKGNKGELCALLNYYRRCYRIIGIVIGACGLLIMPFLPKLINGTYPEDISLYVLFTIYLFNTVISYFMFAYKGALLTAYQRTDIKSNIASVLQVIMFAAQYIVLLVFRNYYLYIIITPIITILTNVITSIVVDRFNPDIKCQGSISDERKYGITQKIKGMFLQKVGVVVLRSVDSIVISAYLGLSILAVYNNYYLIITSVFGIFTIIMESLIPSVGNAMITKSADDNYNDFNKFNFMYYWLVTVSCACLICLYQPFMELWVGKELLLDNKLMLFFGLYFFVHKWMDMGMVYLEAKGIWWEDRFVPVVAATVNLLLNIILVQVVGLYGILISTVISILLVYNTGCIYVLFKYYFERSASEFVVNEIRYAMSAVFVIAITFVLCIQINRSPASSLLIRIPICLIVPNLLQIFIWHRYEPLQSAVTMINSVISKYRRKHK